MNLQITSWINRSAVGCLLLSSPIYALEPLSDQELSSTTAQSRKAIEEQVEQVLATSILLSAADAVKKAAPLEADIEVEGIRLDDQDGLISQENSNVEDSKVVVGVNELLQASRITVDTIKFNDIRIADSPATLGNTSVHGLLVDQSVQIQLR